MLKPHVSMLETNENRHSGNSDTASFLPSNFFPAWKSYLRGLSAIATEAGVDSLCIGTELNHLDWRFREQWVDLIGALRVVFPGELTYDANFSLWKQYTDLDDVVFWDKLDFIGCSLYVHMTRDDNATTAHLRDAWKHNTVADVRDVTEYLRQIAYRFHKRVMALESGYPSVNGGLYATNEMPSETRKANYGLQYRALEAYLGVMYENRGSWLKGISLWELTPNMMSQEMMTDIWYKQAFTVYKKPAAEVVKKFFAMPW